MPTAVEYINAMREQRNISFHMIQKYLTNNNLKSAVSLDKLVSYYSGTASQDALQLQDINKAVLVLEKIYKDHLLYGNRTVFIYKIDKTQVDNVANLLKLLVANDAQKPEVLLFQNSYPFNIDSIQLDKIEIGTKFFIKEFDENNSIRVISCTPRAYRKRFDIAPDALGDDYLEYDEIHAFKTGVNQAFDSIVLHKNDGTLEIQIDTSHPISKDDLNNFRTSYNVLLQDNYRQSNKGVPINIKALNIFSKIMNLYNEEEGNIVVLGHQTLTGSIKHEKMNSKDKNLKIEDFHTGGLHAVNNQIGIFAITKKYDSPKWSKKAKIGLLIDGGVRLIKADSPIINCVEFIDCVFSSDYNYLINKLI
ncbi:hypothetical protein RHO13_10340 [Orbus wheelerorum]|uniref:hypothetical protein n=1 Tax=Orbus wheelerorum TaxID=3074111 RepID=UPI00370D8D80